MGEGGGQGWLLKYCPFVDDILPDPIGISTRRERKRKIKKRLEVNISEWTGSKFGEDIRKAKNREEWRRVVARSSLMPQRSFTLRNK